MKTQEIKKNHQDQETFVQALCAILIKNKIIKESEGQAMAKAFKDSAGDNFGDFLLSEGLVEESDLLQALSQYYKAPSFDVHGYFFNTLLLQRFPKDFLLRNGVIPVEVDGDQLVAVATDPDLPGLKGALESYSGYGVDLLVGIKRDICDAVKEYYDKSEAFEQELEDLDMREENRLEKNAMNESEELTYSDILYRDSEDEA